MDNVKRNDFTIKKKFENCRYTAYPVHICPKLSDWIPRMTETVFIGLRNRHELIPLCEMCSLGADKLLMFT
jgi:hypothetical protein